MSPGLRREIMARHARYCQRLSSLELFEMSSALPEGTPMRETAHEELVARLARKLAEIEEGSA